MLKPKKPENEDERLQALVNLEILDTDSEERFDRLTRIAKNHFQVPIVLVSLVDANRQWFKSCQGLDARETPRDISFCGHAILDDEIFIINNALEDERFADNPLVSGPPDIRFYAGAPLHAPGGERVGTLCLIDSSPRTLSAEQIAMLRDLADCVEAELENTLILKTNELVNDLALVAAYTSNAAIITNNQGLIHWVNLSFETLTGYTLAEIKGKKPGDILQGPDTDPASVKMMHDAIAKGEGFTVEIINYDKQGQEYWVDVRTEAIKDDSGQLIKFIAIETDITEQKQLLLDYQSQLNAISQSQMVAEFTVDGIITKVNELFCQTFAYSREELIGQHHSLLISDKLAHSEQFQSFWDSLRRGEFQTNEFKRLGKNAKEIWIQATYTPILDPYGTPYKIVKFASDISEKIHYLHQLKDNEERTRAVLDNVIDGIVTINEQGIIETFNPAAEGLFGYQDREVIGKNVNQLMPEPYHQEHDSYLKNYRDSGKAKIIGMGREVLGKRKDGSIFQMELAVGEMRLTSQRMFTGIVRDITDRKQAETSKNEFISTVSHELRTPLTSIKGSLGLIKSGRLGDLSENLKSMLDIAYNNSERLVLLINDILDIEKIEAGKMSFSMTEVNVTDLVKEAMEVNKGYAQSYQVQFKLITEIENTYVYADRDRLMQVLSNLMSNAAKFSPAGESIILSIARQDNQIRVSVSDKGIGIADKFKDKIFTKFSQADSSDTRSKGGTGLGLSISKAIIEQHEGCIDYMPNADQGTVFYFQLAEHQRQEPETNRYRNIPENCRVLICEDDPDIALLLQMILKQEDIATDVAHSAFEAQELLNKQRYDAMTLDLMLPDKDGISLLKEIRSIPQHRELPVIVVSAKALESKDELAGNVVRIIDWIGKPINQVRLTESILGCLDVQTKISKVLHVEDELDIITIVETLLQNHAIVSSATTLAQAKKMLDKDNYDLVILDLTLPDGDGSTLLPLLKNKDGMKIPVIIFSAQEKSIDDSYKTIAQVQKYLVKSRTSNIDLLEEIQNAIRSRKNH